MAFYLKYRPQKIADLDLKEVREGLSRALSAAEIPHAFLFAGPRGTGKTSAARIVAKAVNCEKKKASQGKSSPRENPSGLGSSTRRVGPARQRFAAPARFESRSESGGGDAGGELASEPCNQCDSCLSITASTNLDILEIDAASNRGIDDIRNLREKIRLAPIRAKYKVYIIDEAHMLTGEAFNALLKTLEEPPKHAIFVLCTTEPQKLPLTIVSRCLQFNFRRARIEELIVGLKKIVKAEKVDIEEEALRKIARSADGSFRDSQKILEQLAMRKKKISGELVDEILGQVKGAGPEEFLKSLVEKDAKGAVLEIGRVVESGANLRWFTERLLEILRWGLLAKIGVETPDEYMSNTRLPSPARPPAEPGEAARGGEATGGQAETSAFAEASAGGLKIEEIKNLIEIFSKAVLELKTAIIPQLPLEMGVIEFCENSKLKLLEAEQARFGASASERLKVSSSPSNPSFSSSPSGPNPTFDSVCQKWPEVLKAVGPQNHSIQAFLRATRPKEFDGETLILEVFYQFHKTQLESEKCRRLVEETAEAILKIPVKIRCVLGEKKPEKYSMPLPQADADGEMIKIAEEIFGKTAD